MIVLLYGQPASGKTTLAKMLAAHLATPHLLDGDEFREVMGSDAYDKSGRLDNLTKANAVATWLNHNGAAWVVMAFVNPYQAKRAELRQLNEGEVIEVLLESSRSLRREYHAEDFEIGQPDARLQTNGTAKTSFAMLKGWICENVGAGRQPAKG